MRTLLIALCLAFISCIPAKSPRYADMTFHAAQSFTSEQRKDILRAARFWEELTDHRVRLRVDFDVEDSDSFSVLRRELWREHLILRVDDRSVLSRSIDHLTHPEGGTKLTLACTRVDHDGQTTVWFIDQRIERKHFFSIATHEFGHTIGLPDLEQPDSIMSGLHGNAVNWPSPLDRQLCKTARYCDE